MYRYSLETGIIIEDNNLVVENVGTTNVPHPDLTASYTAKFDPETKTWLCILRDEFEIDANGYLVRKPEPEPEITEEGGN